MRLLPVLVVLFGLVGFGLVGCGPTPEPTGSAADILATLDVKGRAPQTGYDREVQFGEAWIDVAGVGCDTRNQILRRDLTGIVVDEDGCRVLSGTLADPYSGTNIVFERGVDTSSAVQVDHVVALSDAWQKGAQQWDQNKRIQFANDPLNLLAVDGPLNEQKSDSDAASWLPPNKEYRCTYVARQVAVKAQYGLWVTQAEHDAIITVLTNCPGQTLPGSGSNDYTSGGSVLTPVPDPGAQVGENESIEPVPSAPGSASSEATSSGVADGDDPRYPSCSQAKKDGYGPYQQDIDREYAWYQDGDSDGTTCE